MQNAALLELTADIVSSHVSNNNVSVSDVPSLVEKVHTALAGLGQPREAEEPQKKTPVVSVRSSVKPDSLTCLACGKKQKTLKRHLMNAHDLTPEQYREEYGLPITYPMVAQDYSETRRSLAKAIGLGRRPKEAATSARAPARKGQARKK